LEDEVKAFFFSSYFGGSDNDIVESIALDAEENMIVVGGSFSTDFPVLNAFQDTFGGGIQPDLHENGGDGFVAKFDNSGTLLWSTYLGGDSLDDAVRVLIDVEENIIVGGITKSINFPVTENVLQSEHRGGGYDIFLAKFAPNGSVLYATFLGGTGNDVLSGMALDSEGNILITGGTSSIDFNTTIDAHQNSFGGISDAFFTKLSPNCSEILYSTYLGGSQSDGVNNINIDSASNVILSGTTFSGDFPLQNAIQTEIQGTNRDLFITKFDPSGVVIFSTLFGGSNLEDPFGATVDSSDNIIVSGRTGSEDFPLVNAAQQQHGGGDVDGIILKLSGDGQEVIFSSFYGGTGWDTVHFVTVDDEDSIIGSGIGSENFPMIRSFQQQSGGGSDFIIMKNTPEGIIEFSTFFGESSSETPYDILFHNNSLFIVGYTSSEFFYTSSGAHQSSHQGMQDGLIIRFDIDNYLAVTPASIPNNPLYVLLWIFIPIAVAGIGFVVYFILKKKH